MKTPSCRQFLPAAIACAIAGLSLMALPPALAINTAPADAAAEIAKSGDTQRELIELKNAVIESPDDARLRERLGRLYLDLGDGVAAEKELNRAMQLGRDDYALRVLLGRAWLLQGDYQRVFTDFDLSRTRSDEDKAALAVLQGNARLASGKLDEARDAFERALALAPGHGPALIGLVEVALEQGDLGAAELELARIGADNKAAGSVDPAELLRLRGNVAFNRERFDEAEQAYREALSLRANVPIVLRGLAAAQIEQDRLGDADQTLQRLLSIKPADGDAVYLSALVAYRQQRFERAALLAGSLVDRGKQVAPPLFIAGAASLFGGVPRQAREYLSRYVALAPEDITGRRLLGETLVQLGEAEEAYKVLRPLAEAAANEAAGDVQLLTLLALAATGAGAVDDAIGFLEQAVALEPDNPRLKAQLAAVRVATEDRQLGLQQLDELAAQDDGNALLAMDMALNRLAYGELDAALDTARRVQDMAPDALEPILVQAIALLRAGQLDAAQAAFAKVLEQQPDNTAARTGVAEILLRRGETEQGLAAFGALVEERPSDITLQMNYAAALLQAGRAQQAEQRLEGIVTNNPSSTAARVALANVYLADALPTKALEVLRDAQDQQEPAVVLATAYAELIADRPEDALNRLGPLVASQPTSIAARLALAKAYERNGDAEAAEQVLEGALALGSDARAVRYAMLRLQLIQPRVPAAELAQVEEAAARFIMEQPSDPRSQVLRGLVLFRTDGQRPLALDVMRETLDANPSGDLAALVANLHVVNNQADAAVELLGRYLSTHPDDTYARLRLARAQLSAADYDAAADNLVLGIEQGARREGLALVTGWTLAVAGRYQDARPYLSQADAQGAAGSLRAHARGLVRLGAGDAPGAVSALRQALAESGDAASPRLRLDLASALLETNDVGRARLLLDGMDASTLSPADRTKLREVQARLR